MIKVVRHGKQLVNYVVVTKKSGLIDVLVDHERNVSITRGCDENGEIIGIDDGSIDSYTEISIQLPKRRWFRKIDYYVDYMLRDKGQTHFLYMPIRFHADMKQIATFDGVEGD